MKNLKTKLAMKCYEEGMKEKELDLRFHLLWRTLNLLVELDRNEFDGLRASIRNFIENNIESFDKDVDFEDTRLDVFYERPVFADLRIEEDRDLYYYQDFNTNRSFRPGDDYGLSIRSFQKILDESDLISIYMSIFKVYDVISKKDDDRYSTFEKRLIEASVYLLECALPNLMEEA